MVAAEGIGFGHLVETCTVLVKIKNCPCTKPHGTEGHFVTTFKVDHSKVKRGPRKEPGREISNLFYRSLHLPQWE